MKKLLLLLPLAFGGLAAATPAAPTPTLETVEQTGRALGLLRLLSNTGPAFGRIRLDDTEGTFAEVYVVLNAQGQIRGRARTVNGMAPVRGTWTMGERGLGRMKLNIGDSELAILVDADMTTFAVLGEWKAVPRSRR